MQYRNLGVLALAGNALAAYVPSEPWSTLTPSATLQGGATSFSGSFGIAINPIATASSSSVVEKKVNRKAEATQIGDGQVQATTGTSKTTAPAVTQIGDGQVQATTTTEKSTAQPVTQIGDGQIQATTTTEKATAQAVTQIGDGQIQATTATEKSTAQAVTQIGDGQVQATTTTEKSTATAATQIGDGQVQATTAKESATPASQIGDGQVQKETSSAPLPSATENITLQACASNGTLTMTLEDSILKDSKGRIGSIVANKQFQFDGPPPQAGAIYAAGWSISEDGKLAIGNSTTFYQCLSGNFYNLYSEEIGSKCEPVELDIVELVSC